MSTVLPDEDTIVAIATPVGRGGVGMIRLSGKEAVSIAASITSRRHFTARKIHFSDFRDEQGVLIDQGLVLYFKAPHSFTGEDVIEFQTHGSPIVLDQLVNCCVQSGARLAKPGEFSLRAFLNDKMDLTQAEAIADLIDSSSVAASRMAAQSLQGAFSRRVHALNERVVYLRTYVEAAIDFPEEDIDFLVDGKIEGLLNELLDLVGTLLSQATQGAMMREGLSVVIAGQPNAGKSTLINRLSGREVAIVTDIPGTTRDVMKEFVLLDGLPIHLVDTAGLRDSEDVVEKEGIRRAYEELNRADCVLFMVDAQHQPSSLSSSLDETIQQRLPQGVPVLTVFNKIDQIGDEPHAKDMRIYLSAKTGEGIPLLIAKMKEVAGFRPAEGQFIARRRHLDALARAKSFLKNGQEQLHTAKALELLAEDLRQAHLSLCEITGAFRADDLLGEIFSNFCIGK